MNAASHPKEARLVGPKLKPLPYATVNQVLAATATSRLGLTFLDAAEKEETLSYHELYQRARRMAGALRSIGVARGDRVALVLPTSSGFMDAFFGTLLAGAVPVPLYPPVRLGRLAEYHERTAAMLQAVGAVLLLSDQRIRRLLGHATEKALPPLGCRVVESLRGGRPWETDVGPKDLALIQFSSGTTRDPRPVALTHQNVMANLSAIDSYLPEGGPHPQAGVSWLPLYHDMGLIGCLLSALAHPGPLTLIPPEVFLAKPAIWLRAISRQKATVSAAPNFAFGVCLRRVDDRDMEGVDLSSWRLALNGAETISADVSRRFCERFGRYGFRSTAMTPVYGLSEAALAVSFSPPEQELATWTLGGREVVSVGQPVPGVEVEIRREAAVAEVGEVGRILVRGPSLMDGYFKRPSESSAILQDGWLDTGDLGFIRDGALHVCGRTRDIIVLRGQNHSPQAFEEALDGVPGVRTGCVVAVGFTPSEADGEELAILAEVVGDPAPSLADEIRVAVLEHTGIRPHTVRLLPPGTLPRTSSGKMRRAEARRQLCEGGLSRPAPVGMVSLASALLGSQLAFARARTRGFRQR